MFLSFHVLEKNEVVEYDANRLHTMAYVRIFLILLASFFIFPQVVSAQSTPAATLDSPEMISSDPAALESAPQGSSEYVLPYPGMLPTNPLYFLKSFRDSLIGFIISDPLKKAEFELLQADKKLAAAQFLLKEPGNTDRALNSVEESEGHFVTAFKKLVATETKSADSQAVFQKMAASLGKHQEILVDLSESTRNTAFSTHAQKASELKEKVDSYL